MSSQQPSSEQQCLRLGLESVVDKMVIPVNGCSTASSAASHSRTTAPLSRSLPSLGSADVHAAAAASAAISAVHEDEQLARQTAVGGPYSDSSATQNSLPQFKRRIPGTIADSLASRRRKEIATDAADTPAAASEIAAAVAAEASSKEGRFIDKSVQGSKAVSSSLQLELSASRPLKAKPSQSRDQLKVALKRKTFAAADSDSD